MKLIFRENHLSISQFNPTELNDFTVLTGVNGSGKSHLLDAIEKRKVVIEGMDNERIVLFNYETFKLENESAFNAQQLASEREAALNYFNQQIRNNITSWRQPIGENYPNLKKLVLTIRRSFGKSLQFQKSINLNKTSKIISQTPVLKAIRILEAFTL